MSDIKSTGTRAQVMHGTAKKTSGGLTKAQLKYNKQGKIVSRKASALAKKNNRLVKAGYVTEKGVVGNAMKGGLISIPRFGEVPECSTVCGNIYKKNSKMFSRKCIDPLANLNQLIVIHLDKKHD